MTSATPKTPALRNFILRAMIEALDRISIWEGHHCTRIGRQRFAKDVAQRCPGGVVTAHSVNAAPRRSGRRTQINTAHRRPIWNETQNWPNNQLTQIRRAAVDIATGQIRIRSFKINRAHFVTRENAVAKPGSEALDLRFDLCRHVDLTPERHMRVSPEDVLSARGASFIEKTLLRNQHKRTLRNLPECDVALGICDFVNCAAQMNRSGTATSLRFPWNGG